VTYDLPGPLTKSRLESGQDFFRHGSRYRESAQKSLARGFKAPAQIIIDKAQGDFVWDLDGNRYIDLQNGWATNPLGNCHPEVVEAVHKAHIRYGYHWEHPLRFELAEQLAEIMPGRHFPRFSFEVSGTEAVEAAIHLALCHTQRRYIISFTSAFHGESLGTKMLSGYGSENNLYMEPWAGGVLKAPFPYSENIPADMSPDQYVDYCLWYLETHIPSFIAPADNVAAVIIEPGLAEGGNWIPSKGFLAGIRRICDKFDWLMIADEVLTGLGRTGSMWGIDHYSVLPDMIVVGKNLSGGIEACAGVATRDEILGDNPRASSGSTFAGTPGGCAAGLKTLEIYQRDGIVSKAAELADFAADRMASWTERYAIVKEVRCLGLLMGVSFSHPEPSSLGEGYEDSWVARTVRNEMLVNGVWAICDTEPTVRMYPALNMDKQNLSQALELMESAIQKVENGAQLVGDFPAMPSGVTGF
jgi:4-aminobutyrate aminotransferase-like enzyme